MATFKTIEEAQKAFGEISAKAKAGGLGNFPGDFASAVPNFVAGETFKNLIDPFDTAEQQRVSDEVGRLTSSGGKRDIPADLVPSFQSGAISLEELTRRIQGTPNFDPSTGPKVDIGTGPVATQKGTTGAEAVAQLVPETPTQQAQQSVFQPLQEDPTQLTKAGVLDSGAPAPTQPSIVTVQPGETLGEIAAREGVPVSSITGFRSGDPDLIFPGEQLIVNRSGTIPSNAPVGINDIATQAANIKSQLDTIKRAEEEGLIIPEGGNAVQLANDFLSEKGVSTTGEEFNDNPLKAYENLLTELFDNAETKGTQDEINASLEEIKKIDDKFAEEVEDIEENPWISEALRSKKIRLAEEKADRKRGPLADVLTLQQTIQQRNREEAKFIATTALNMFQKDRAFALDQLEFLAERAEKSSRSNSQVVEAGGRQLLIDKDTGETIKDIGASKVAGKEGKFSTTQFTAGGFASRLVQANQIFSDLDASGFDPAQLGARESFFPEFAKSEEVKKLNQAERNFVNATLRRESGAAIAPEEFVSAEKQYFPRTGDTPEVLNQKRLNRLVVQENFINEAGGAFTPPSQLIQQAQEAGRGAGTATQETFIFEDPKTGIVREFLDMTPEDVEDALNRGFIRK